jgi:hypothetical protein
VEKRKRFWLIVLLLLLLLGLLCTTSYLWWQSSSQRKKLEREKAELQSELEKAEERIKSLKDKLAEAERTPPSAVTTSEAKGEEKTTKVTKTVKKCGYIKKIYLKGGKYYLDIDYIQFLTGDEAYEAALEDGVITTGEPVPNDYYIRNVNPKIRTFPIDENVEVFIETIPGPEMTIKYVGKQSLDFATFKQRFETENASREMPHWITLQDSVVVKIEEQYVP